jgi:hypothetical protein
MEFKESKIFMCIFNDLNNKQNDDQILYDTINHYNEFFEMLKNKNINDIDEDILEIISKSFTSINELKDNIKKISELEEEDEEKKIELYNSIINDDDGKIIIEKIYLFYRKNELILFLKNIEKFNNSFKCSDLFNKKREFIINKFSESKLLPNFEEIKEIICEWDKNLMIEKQEYEIIFNILLYNENLLSFLKEKDNNDLMNLRELIDPLQTQIVSFKDIDDLVDLIKLKDGIKKIAKNDTFILDFSNLISQLYKEQSEKDEVIKKIKSVSDKINDIIEIFNKKLNKNLFAEQKFDAISKNGIFDIQYESNKGYKCIVISQIPEDDNNNNENNIINNKNKIKEEKNNINNNNEKIKSEENIINTNIEIKAEENIINTNIENKIEDENGNNKDKKNKKLEEKKNEKN